MSLVFTEGGTGKVIPQLGSQRERIPGGLKCWPGFHWEGRNRSHVLVKVCGKGCNKGGSYYPAVGCHALDCLVGHQVLLNEKINGCCK